uniref:Uncharacterized protein n=1 Tax=Ditylenchus dipsaci TaxID=166011 RepID=A0A915E3B6_9BILA
MSFNYWPKIRLFCFVFACWNIAGVFCFKKLVIGDKIRTRREVAQNELLEEFKSRAALTALSSQSWDENGNIVINGRLDVSSSFSIISQIKTEAELGIVICRQDANSKCDKPGLVLCYKANGPFDEKQIHRNDEHFNHLKKVCRKENGFVVTTETTETENFFRIDTRFGNTYRVIIPAKNCIVLWLTYDIFGVDDRKVFENNQNYRVYALNSATEIANLNTTKIGTKYAQDWSYVSEYENETLINMLWKEVHVEPRLDEIYSNISFSASGGDYCCALTAKIVGNEKEVQLRKFEKKTAINVESASASTENKIFLKDTSVSQDEVKLMMKQLISVCCGVIAHLNTTASFTNDPATMEHIAQFEQDHGYPPPSVYDSCPFFTRKTKA